MSAWDPDAVRAGVWHSVDSVSSLAPPGIHSADEIARVAFKVVAIGKQIVDAECETSMWECGSLDFSYQVLGQVVNYCLSNGVWTVKGQPGVLRVILAICNILGPCEVDGVVVCIILYLWALWSALSFPWCAFNASSKSKDGATTNSIVDVDLYIGAAVTVM